MQEKFNYVFAPVIKPPMHTENNISPPVTNNVSKCLLQRKRTSIQIRIQYSFGNPYLSSYRFFMIRIRFWVLHFTYLSREVILVKKTPKTPKIPLNSANSEQMLTTFQFNYSHLNGDIQTRTCTTVIKLRRSRISTDSRIRINLVSRSGSA